MQKLKTLTSLALSLLCAAAVPATRAADTPGKKSVLIKTVSFTLDEKNRDRVARLYPALLGAPGSLPIPPAFGAASPGQALPGTASSDDENSFVEALSAASAAGLVNVVSRNTCLAHDGEEAYFSAGFTLPEAARRKTPPAALALAEKYYSSTRTMKIRPRVVAAADGADPSLELSISFEDDVVSAAGRKRGELPSVERRSLTTTFASRPGRFNLLGGFAEGSGDSRRTLYVAVSARELTSD